MRTSLTILTLSIAAMTSTTALAAETPRQVKSEFRQNIVKRDRLVRELAAIDSKAANAVVAGKEPIALHADQIELQDQIDLLQLRLETMALRWNLDLPLAPQAGVDTLDESEVVSRRIESAFQEGRNRTDRALQERCKSMLASIDYSSFLARAE